MVKYKESPLLGNPVHLPKDINKKLQVTLITLIDSVVASVVVRGRSKSKVNRLIRHNLQHSSTSALTILL